MATDLGHDGEAAAAAGHCNGGYGGRRCVLVGVDESEHSFYALEWVLRTLIVSSTSGYGGARDLLVLLHAKPSIAHPGGPGYILSAEMVVSMERAQDRRIQELISKALELCARNGVKAEMKVESGDPRDFICEMVESLKPDFLVLGSHGYGAIKRAVLGSVSDYCAHHAKCPVIIVKKPHQKKANLHQQ